MAREKGALGGLVGEGADHQADDRTGGNRSQDRIAAIIVMDPVITIRRLVQAPIIVITDDDRVIVVAIMSTNPVIRHIVSVIDKPKGRPRVVMERTVSTIIERAR